jgi:ubiquinone/menaquinone biosynthesis C-methylase UbiE
MYKKLREFFKKPIYGKILGISDIENFRALLSKTAEVLDVQYPEVDMENIPYEDNIFDFVISDQVIEHLEDPQKAIKESYRVLKRGGIAIHTTCFINYIHPSPRDFWRFSPEALKHLCKDFSKILYCGSWGNRIAILLCFLSDRFRFMKIPETKWSIRHLIATYNEEKYPIVTWVVAEK